jgi:membrane protein DedA with SNARE-associated domain
VGSLADLFDGISSAPDGVVVLVAALLAMLEASAFVGLVVPGETVVLLAGAVTAGDGPPAALVVAVVAAGSMVGDSLGYLLGRTVGERLRRSRPGRWIGAARWAAADEAIASAGGRTVALARFVGVAHAVTPAVAGMGGMPYRRFLTASAVGSSVWATAYVVVGRMTGGSWERLDGRLRLAVPVAAALVIVVSIVVLRRRVRHRRVATVAVAPVAVLAAPVDGSPTSRSAAVAVTAGGGATGCDVLVLPRQGGACAGCDDDDRARVAAS